MEAKMALHNTTENEMPAVRLEVTVTVLTELTELTVSSVTV
jgi:hypothetical protein